MRHKRAVEKLRTLTEACGRVKLFWFDTEPFLKAVYAFGDVLDGTDPLDAVQVALAIDLPPEEVPWESTPDRTDALAHLREVRDRYWDHDWRREHRGYGRYPENELWEAVQGYLDLADAARSSKPGT